MSELEALRGRLRQLVPTPASEQELLSVLSHQRDADSSSLGAGVTKRRLVTLSRLKWLLSL